MFDIVLMTNSSPRNFMNKAVSSVITVTGALRDECSLIRPIIEIEMASVPSNVNYMYIAEFGRYYFVGEPVSVRTGLWRFICEVDPLMSFKGQLMLCQGIVRRGEQASLQNVKLDDGSFKVYSDPYIITKSFPQGFSSPSYVLAVAGRVHGGE